MSFVLAIVLLAVCLTGAVAASHDGQINGGDKGYLRVLCNVDGADVDLYLIDGVTFENNKICFGCCMFDVCTTAIPLCCIVVSKEGYYTQVIPVITPGKDVVIDVSVNLRKEG